MKQNHCVIEGIALQVSKTALEGLYCMTNQDAHTCTCTPEWEEFRESIIHVTKDTFAPDTLSRRHKCIYVYLYKDYICKFTYIKWLC